MNETVSQGKVFECSCLNVCHYFLKTHCMFTLGKKEEYHKKYEAKDNILYREMSTVWGIESHFKGNYYKDYLEMTNPSITWRDKYTFCNIFRC